MLIATLAAQEALFRAAFPIPEVSNFNRVAYSQMVLGEGAARSPLVNASFTWSSRPDGVSFTHHLNLYGFRDRAWRLEKGSRRRVAIVGDSLVEGFMASDEETLPRGFERRAAQRGEPLEVLNLGVGAAQLPDYFQLIRDLVVVLRPDDIVLVLYANDLPAPPYDPSWLANPIVPERSASWRPRALDALIRMKEGRPVPRRWGSPPFSFLPAVPSERNPWTHREAEWGWVNPAVAQSMKDGAFNPYVVDAVGSYARYLRTPVDLRPHFAALAAYLGAHGTRLAVTYIPYSPTVSDHYLAYARSYSRAIDVPTMTGAEFQLHERCVRSSCEAVGIRFHSLGDEIRTAERQGTHLYWNYDEHLRGLGYQFAGAVLHDWWRSG